MEVVQEQPSKDIIPTTQKVQEDLGKEQPHNDMEDQSRFMLLSKGAYNVYYYGSAGKERGIEKSNEELHNYLPTHNIIPELSDDESIVVRHQAASGKMDSTIAYRGTDIKNYKDFLADLSVLGGMIKTDLYDSPLPRFQRALDKFDKVKELYPDDKIQTTGHSLGGTIAVLVGKKRDANSYGFNIGSSPLDWWKEQAELRTSHHKATIWHKLGDPISASNYFLDKHDKIIATPTPTWKEDLLEVVKAGAWGAFASVERGANPYVALTSGLAKSGLVAAGQINKYHNLENFAPKKDRIVHLESDDSTDVRPLFRKLPIEIRGHYHPMTDFLPRPKHNTQTDWAMPTIIKNGKPMIMSGWEPEEWWRHRRKQIL
tara:strand:+ start:1252 stop:2367 length:1116 start_codon:yes stop_codon:yes gene_type:complete